MNNNAVFARIRKLNHIAGIFFTHWEYNKGSNSFICDQGALNILGREEEINSQEEIFSWLNSCPVFREAFDKLINNNKNLDITVSVEDNGQTEWLRVVGMSSEIDSNLYGFIENVTKNIRKDSLYRNRNIEMNSFEKGLEQFSIVARTDGRGRITYANEEFCRLSKYTEEELLGQDHRIVNSGFHPKEFFKEMWSCIMEGRNWRGVVKNKAKDGSFYWVDTIIIPVLSTRGVLTEILSFRFNVTQAQELREENLRLRKEIECLKFDLHKEEVLEKA